MSNQNQPWNTRKTLYAIIIGLTLLFIYVGISGSIGAWDKWFLIAGVLLLIPFLIGMIRSKQILSKQASQEAEALVEFKKKADQVIVPLGKLEIKANS